MFYLGMGLFFGTHGLMLVPGIRRQIVGLGSETAYMGFYSLMSLAGLVLIVLGYERHHLLNVPSLPNLYQWSPIIMFLAFWMIIAANLPCWIKHWLKHPMTIGIVLWALVHLSVSSNLHAWLMFGTFAVLMLVAALTVGVRGKTPVGSDRPPKGIFDVVAVAVGAALTALVGYLHGTWFGVIVF
jgi:uncharacterized membrane protein